MPAIGFLEISWSLGALEGADEVDACMYVQANTDRSQHNAEFKGIPYAF